MKGIDTKQFEVQKFEEEVSKFILEEQKRIDGLRDLLKQFGAGVSSGKELRSKMNLFRASLRKEKETLNHLIGMAVELTRREGKEVNLYP